MNQSIFKAHHWLLKDSTQLSPDKLINESHLEAPISSPSAFWLQKFPSFINKDLAANIVERDDSGKFHPSKFLTPGWKGDSLCSKSIIQFQKIFEHLKTDAFILLQRSKVFNRSLKNSIYNEFLSYCKEHNLVQNEINDLQSFWTKIQDEHLVENNLELFKFAEIFCYRTVLIFLLKIRFITILGKKAQITIVDENFLYPTSFLSRIFKKGSSLELKSRAIEFNVFNWYRPEEEQLETLRLWKDNCTNISLSEVLFHSSVHVQGHQSYKKIYSHSLSHKNFGLFLNSLLINLPLWLQTLENQSLEQNCDLEIISCKYKGDYLESMALSHWLAQENNMYMKWDQILCPDFKGDDFSSGLFMKICQELQFMSFLANSSHHQNLDPIHYIANTMSGHFCNRKNTSSKNKSLYQQNPFFSSSYNRIILNLNTSPKNNPYQFIFHQITDQIPFLKDNGFLFVLSNKDLFISSQKDKLKSAFDQLNLVGIIDLENLKGKGELTQKVYLFQKKPASSVSYQVNEPQRCFIWRFHGEMTSFQQFTFITESFRAFFLSHIGEAPSVYQNELPRQGRMEFYQDAISSGHLIHSSQPDGQTITHPSFFKKILDCTLPFDTFFEIRELTKADLADSNHVNWKQLNNWEKPCFLDLSLKNNEMKLRIHFLSDYDEHIHLHPFKIVAKNTLYSPILLNPFFDSPIGQQLTSLSIIHPDKKLKTQIAKIPVPRILSKGFSLGEHPFSKMCREGLNKNQSICFLEIVDHLYQSSARLFKELPHEFLEILFHAKQSLRFSPITTKHHHFLFESSSTLSLLTQTKTLPLTATPDVYVEMVKAQKVLSHITLTKIESKQFQKNSLTFNVLNLLHNEEVIVTIHSEPVMLQFLDFILSKALGHSVHNIINNLRVPSLEILNSIQDNALKTKTDNEKTLNQINSLEQLIFHEYILNN